MIKQYKIIKLSSKCAGTIGDPKTASTSLYDGTEPGILLPKDMHALLNHQLTMRSHIDLEIVITMNGKIIMHKVRQVIKT